MRSRLTCCWSIAALIGLLLVLALTGCKTVGGWPWWLRGKKETPQPIQMAPMPPKVAPSLVIGPPEPPIVRPDVIVPIRYPKHDTNAVYLWSLEVTTDFKTWTAREFIEMKDGWWVPHASPAEFFRIRGDKLSP